MKNNKDSCIGTSSTNKKILSIAKQAKVVSDAVLLSPAKIETALWVRLKCQYGCEGYGKCLSCPPFSPTPEKMRRILDSYSRMILLKLSPENRVETTEAVVEMTNAIYELERFFFLRGAWKAFGLGSGPCLLCKKCAVKEGICRQAKISRPSMEACGIDVFSTALKAGFDIEVLTATQDKPNYYGLILLD